MPTPDLSPQRRRIAMIAALEAATDLLRKHDADPGGYLTLGLHQRADGAFAAILSLDHDAAELLRAAGCAPTTGTVYQRALGGGGFRLLYGKVPGLDLHGSEPAELPADADTDGVTA